MAVGGDGAHGFADAAAYVAEIGGHDERSAGVLGGDEAEAVAGGDGGDG